MFEKELERARKALAKELATTNPYVTLQAVVGNGGVHPSYRSFFGAEVAWWVHEERALRQSNPRFDTSEARLRELFAKMDEELVKAARFDHEELNSIIDAATKVRLNYLLRPRATLKWFVFRGEPTKPISEVLLRLQYLHDHEYLADGIRQWAQHRGSNMLQLEILSIVEFERIVEKVDNDAILDLSQDQFVRLLDPIFEFFAENNPELPPESIPTEAVIIFLDDKGAIPISQTLERLLYSEDLKIITRSKFLDVIDNVIDEIEAGVLPGPTQQPPTPSVPSTPTDHIEPEEITLEQVESEPATSESVEEIEAALDSREQSTQQPTQQLETDLGSSYERRYEVFSSDVDERQRAQFLAKIFNGDTVQMEQLIGDVLGSPTWKIGSAKLDHWFVRNKVDTSKTVAMELTHALNRSFR